MCTFISAGGTNSTFHFLLRVPVHFKRNSYLRPQRQVLLLQLLQLAPHGLQLAERRSSGRVPCWRRGLLLRRGHTGVGLALLRGAGDYPQQLVLLAELMLELVHLQMKYSFERIVRLKLEFQSSQELFWLQLLTFALINEQGEATWSRACASCSSKASLRSCSRWFLCRRD